METTISDFHTSFYIPAINKLAFHLPIVRILGTNHCGESRRTAFKRRELFQDVLCSRDYAEKVVSCSSPRWDNLPSGHQRNPLLGPFGKVHVLGSKILF